MPGQEVKEDRARRTLQVTTDAEGHSELNLPEGPYSITVQHPAGKLTHRLGVTNQADHQARLACASQDVRRGPAVDIAQGDVE